MELKSQSSITRFWKAVKMGLANECWPYLGALDSNGYGRLRRNGKRLGVHRIALLLSKGDPPSSGLFACHICDNPPCCNPNHLYWGTPKQNSQDALNRGQISSTTVPRMGSKNSQSKLNEDQVKEMFRLFKPGYGNTKRLSEQFDVSTSTVQRIVHGRGWLHV